LHRCRRLRHRKPRCSGIASCIVGTTSTANLRELLGATGQLRRRRDEIAHPTGTASGPEIDRMPTLLYGEFPAPRLNRDLDAIQLYDLGVLQTHQHQAWLIFRHMSSQQATRRGDDSAQGFGQAPRSR
jgi:hypothetical protein